jgi:cell division protein FtsN
MSIQREAPPSFVANRSALQNDQETPETEPVLRHVHSLGKAIPARAPVRTKKKDKNSGVSRVLRSVGPIPMPEQKVAVAPRAPSAEALVPVDEVKSAVVAPITEMHRTLFKRANAGGEAIARATTYPRTRVQSGASSLAGETGDYRGKIRQNLSRMLKQTAENYRPPAPVVKAPVVPEPVKVVVVKPEPKPVPVKRVSKPKAKPVSKPKKVAVKPAPSNRAYTIQIHAFKDSATAQEVASAIGKFKGKLADIRSQQRDEVTWYRVQIGSFNNLTEARSFQKAFEAQKGLANTFLVAR